MENELRSRYQIYIDNCIETAKKNGFNHLQRESVLTEEEFVSLIADAGITKCEQRDYFSAWDGIIRPALSRIVTQEMKEPELSYGMKKASFTPDGVNDNDSTYVLVNSNRQIIVRKEDNGYLQISALQYCEEGTYEFYISNNSDRFSFRFYPNESLIQAAKEYGTTLEDIKRKFVSGYSYGDLMPSKAWVGDDNWMMQETEKMNYSMDIKEDEYTMIANKLFREGLDKIFKSKNLTITPEEKDHYKQMIEETKKRVVIIPLEKEKKHPSENVKKDTKRVVIIQSDNRKPTTKRELSLLSEEESKKLDLLKQLQALGMDLSEDQLKEMDSLHSKEIRSARLKEYQEQKDERNQQLDATLEEGRDESIIRKMEKETKVLEQLATTMPLSDMQKVVLKLNKIYMNAYESAKRKIELKQMTEEKQNEIDYELNSHQEK